MVSKSISPLRNFTFLMFFLSTAISHAQSSAAIKACEKLKQVSTPNLAWKHFVAMKCDASLTPSEGKIFSDYIKAVENARWQQFPTQITRSEYLEIREAYKIAQKHYRDLGPFEFPNFTKALAAFDETAGRFDVPSFTSFLVRIFPCSDGARSEDIAHILTKWFVQDPKMSLEAALKEQISFEQDSSKDTCTQDLRNAIREDPSDGIAARFAEALNFVWNDEGIPAKTNAEKALRRKLPELKRQFSDKRIAIVFDACETIEIEEAPQPRKGGKK